MGQKTPEVPEYLEFLEYLISCFLGLCSLGYLAFVSWLPVFVFLFSLVTYRNVFTQAWLCQRMIKCSPDQSQRAMKGTVWRSTSVLI